MAKKMTKRILTAVLALIMALSSLSGAFPVMAYADDEIPEGIVVVENEEAGEEPTEEPTEEPAEEPEKPVEEPAEEPAEEPSEEPAEEAPTEYPLDAVLIVSNEETVRLATEAAVVSVDTVPELRLWTEEEEELYGAYLAELGEEALAKLALFDAATEETGIRFTERATVRLTGAALDAEGEYRLYLAGEDGVFYEAELDEDKSFEADYIGLAIITYEAPEEEEPAEPVPEEELHREPEVYDNLAETDASDDEPLLAIDELSDETLALLGIEREKTDNDGAPKGAAGQLPGRAGTNEGEGNAEETGEDDRLPWESDSMVIEVLKIEWKPSEYGQVVDPIYMDILCSSDNVIDQKFQIDLSTSGSEVIQPGALEIVIPAYLWKTRPVRDEAGNIVTEGKEPGALYLSVPEEPEHGADFAWRRVGDKIIITNTHMMAGTTRALIQGSFRGVSAHEMEDGTDSREYTTFNVQANLTIESGRVLNRTGNMSEKQTDNGTEYEFTPIYATIDTYAGISSVSKTAVRSVKDNEYYIYHEIPSNLPALLRPADPENYSYVRWVVNAYAYGSQPFVMTFTDTLPDTDYNIYGGRILGAEALIGTYNDGQTVKKADEGGRSVSGVLYDGYNLSSKMAIVWVAYPKANFEEGKTYTVSNGVEAAVEGWDDWLGNTRTGVDENVRKTASASGTAPFRLPITYHVTKIWDDNDNEKGRRPSYQSVNIYRDGKYWTGVSLSDSNDWVFTWNDGGQPHTYSVSEAYLSYGSASVDDMDREERVITFWHYSQEKLEWDESTKTWTFTNKYNERKEIIGRVPWIIPGTSSRTYKNHSTYWDSSKDSSRDRVLNLIRRGEEANISYGVSGSGNFMSYTIDSEFSPGEVIIGPTTDIFGKRSARFEVIDQGAYFYDSAKLSDQVVNLDPEDYEITSVTMNAPTIRVYTQPDIFENAYWTSDEEASRETPVILFGRTDESAEWVKYATYLGGSITTENEATASGNTVYLPSGVHQVKQQLDTNGHGASINYSVNIKLIPSEHMLNEIIEPAFTRDEDENYIMLQLYNTAESVISDPTGEIEAKVTSGDSAIAYLHGRNYKNSVTLDKQYDRLSNGMYYDDRDVIARMIKFSNTVTLTLQSNVVSYDDYMDVISDGSISNPRGGTFYDLLPLGVQPDMDSIKVDGGTGNDKVIEKYLIENFRGSGRTMLVVKVSFDDHITYMGMISETQRYSYDYQKYRGYSSNYPTTGYKNVHTLTYTSAMPWIEYQNRKTTVGIPPLVNSVAFESDEASLGNIAGWSGEKDKADYASDGDYANCRTKQELMRYGQDERELMTDLDPNSDAANFVYAGAKVDITGANVSAVFNAEKQVSTDGLNWASGTFADSPVTIYEGATYIYRITISPEEEDSIAGMTIFDPLEVYYPLEGETGYDTKGSWKGIIESVDTSQMSSWNIDPKVYYYIGGLTLGGMPLSDAEDCFNQINLEDGNWVTEMPADRSTVTAVYVDATRDVDGNPYTLPKGQRISVDIHMRSPLGEAPFADSENRYDAAENAHAFNRTLVAGWLTKGQGDEGVYATNRTQFSKVGILPYSIEVEKEWNDLNDNDGVRPDSVTVELYGNGELVATTEVTAANNWHGSFDHVRRYDDDSVPIQYTIKEIEIKDGETVLYTYEAERVSSGNSTQVFRLKNTHELITTRVPFTKEWDTSLAGDDEKARPDYIVVDLYRWVWDAEPDAETGERTGKWQYTGKRMIVRPDESGNWYGEFSGAGVYKFDKGEEIIYTVRETPVYKYTTTYDETEFNNPTIINTYWPYGDLVISKNIENATDIAREKGIFKFTLLLKYEGEEHGELYPYAKYNEGEDEPFETGNIGNGAEFTLTDGQRLEITDIMSEVDYEVIETPADGYAIKSRSGSKGAIKAGETKYARFINRYSSKANANVSVTKVLKGHAIGHNQFSFSLIEAETGKVISTAYTPATAYDPATHTATATVTFPRLNYTDADDGKTYTYIIKENVPEEYPDGYTVFDGSEYTYTITLTDNGDGTMKKTEAYGGTESASTAPTFTNEYHAEGELELKAWKTLKGGKVYDYDFRFEVVKPDGTQVATAGVEADGTILFPGIKLTEQDVGNTYLYIVREINTGDERVNYDDHVFGYKARVYDGNNGTLTFRIALTAVELGEDGVYVAVDGDVDPLFENTLKEGSLSITKYATWPDGQEPEDKEFTFHVEFFGEILPDNVQVEKSFESAITVGIGGMYMTLQEAFDAAEDGDTIILVSDLDHQETATLNGNKSVTLDLKDHTIYNNVSSGDYAVVVPVGSNLTLEGGAWVGGNLFMTYDDLTINSGEYLPGGTLFYAYKDTDGSETVTVNGGYFKGGHVDNYSGVNWIYYGGQFDGVSYSLYYGENHPFICGGSYTKNPKNQIYSGSNLVPKGYKVVTGADTIPGYSGTVYTVIPDPDAPMIVKIVRNRGEALEFPSLRAAVNAAINGDTIVALMDFDITERSRVSDKEINIDFTGHTVTVINGSAITAENGAIVNVKGGTFKSSSPSLLYVYNGAQVNIEGGEFEFLNNSSIIDVSTNGRAVISGGHLKCGRVQAYSDVSYGYEVTGEAAISGDVSFYRNNNNWPYISGGYFELDPDTYGSAIMPGYEKVEAAGGEIPGYDGTVYTVQLTGDADEYKLVENTRTGERFATLALAFKSAEDGDTVRLLGDYDLGNEVFNSDKSITFDLNGHVINADAPNDRIRIEGEKSELTIKGGTWNKTSSNSGYDLIYIYRGKLNIEGGSWNSTNGERLINVSYSSNTVYPEVTISGGNFYSSGTIVYASSYADVNITGGEFISGELYQDSGSGSRGLNITGGIFRDGVNFSGSAAGYISGGLYAMSTSKFAQYIVPGYKASDEGETIDGYSGIVYSIVEDEDMDKPFLVNSTGEVYATLKAAFEAAAEEDTITVVSDASLTSATLTGKKITIEAEGQSISVTNSAQITLYPNSELTINGGTWEETRRDNNYFLYIQGGSAIINSGTFLARNTTRDYIYITNYWDNGTNNYGSLEINGGEFYKNSNNDLIEKDHGAYLTINGGYFDSGSHFYIHSNITGGDSGAVIKGGSFAYSGSGLFSTCSDPVGFMQGGLYTWSTSGSWLGAGCSMQYTSADTIKGYSGSVYKIVGGNYDKNSVRIVRTGTTYDTLDEAFVAAQDGDTIELIGNTTMTGSTTISGKSLTIEGGEYLITIPDGNRQLYLSNGSKLTINGGDWYFAYYYMHGTYFIDCYEGTELTVNSGKWTLESGDLYLFAGAGSITINGGEYDLSDQDGYSETVADPWGSGVCTVNDGVYNNCRFYGGSLLTITGGKYGPGVSFESLIIMGGYFARTPEYLENYVAAGYKIVEAEGVEIPGYTGTVYTVEQDPDAEIIARIVRGEETLEFYSLEQALANAEDGDTVELLADDKLKGTTNISGKEITLEAGEHRITIPNGDKRIFLQNGSKLTINGGDWYFESYYMHGNWFLYQNTGTTLVINGGKWTLAYMGESLSLIYTPNGAYTEINGGEFDLYGTGCDIVYTYQYDAKYVRITDGYYNNCRFNGTNSSYKSWRISGGKFGPNVVFQNGYITGGYFAKTPSELASCIKPGYHAEETDEVEIPNYSGTVYKVVPDEGTEPEPEPDPQADFVAQIVRTGDKYRTLEAALIAAENGDTVELIADAALYSSTGISGKELTIEGGEHQILIPSRDARIYLNSGAKLTINGGDWFFASYNMWGDYFITAYSNSELTVNSGSWYLNSGEIALFRADNGAKITVNGGEYDLYSSSSRYAIYSYSQNPEDVVINGGYFENCHFYASSNNGSRGWEIKGGKFGENVTFENGYLSGGYYALEPSYLNQYTRPGYKAVHAPEDVTIPYYFDAVYSVAKVDDDTVVAGVAVNDRTGIEYESLSEALTSAEEGDTVILLANAALDSWVGLYENITLDLDGHTVTSTDYINLYSGSGLTLKGGNWISDRYYTVFSINSGSKLTVESGSFTNTTNYNNTLFGLEGGELEIKGGAFNWNYGKMISAGSYNSNKLTISGGDFSNLYSSYDTDYRCLIYWDSSSGANTQSEITGGTFRRGYLNINNSKLSITGGEYLSEVSLNGNSGFIKGGLWAFEPNSGYISSGYKAEITDKTIGGYTGTVYEIVTGEELEPVVKDKDTGEVYYTLADALTTAPNGAKLELLRDTRITNNNITMTGSSVSLDLKDYSVYNDGYYITIQNGAHLTLEGGHWLRRSNYLFQIDYGTLYIKSGEFKNETGYSSSSHLIYGNNSEAKIIISGGVFDQSSPNYSLINFSSSTDYASAITGGEFRKGQIYYSNSNSSGFSILGGVFSPDVTFGRSSSTSRFIKGGSFGKSADYIAGYCLPGYVPHEDTEVTMTGYESTTFYTVSYDKDAPKAAEIVESGAQYFTLEDAIKACGRGQTVKLLDDVSVVSQLNIAGKSLTLDLDGHTVALTDSGYFTLNSGADVTLTGDGKWIVQTGSHVFNINSGAKLKVESGSFEKTATNSSNYLIYIDGGELEITGGTFDWSYYHIIYASSSNTNKLTISGGDFTNTYSSNNSNYRSIIYWNSSSGTNNQSVISGGTFRRGWLNIFNSSLTITGGEFLSEISLNGYSNTPYIKGGLWAFQPSSSYIRTGYKAQVSAQTIAGYSGTVYEITEDPAIEPIAEDNQGNKFYSVADIISDSVSGSTVTLLKDATWNQTWNLANKKLTLDLDGHTVTMTSNMYLNSGADLTVTGDGTWSVQTSNTVFLISSGAKLKVESGSFAKTSQWSNYLFYLQGGELEITGGTFDWVYNTVYASSYNSNKLTISGGDFTNSYSSNDSTWRSVVYWDSSSGTNNRSVISSGVFRSGYMRIYNSSLSITGGTFMEDVTFQGNTGTGYIKGGYYAMKLTNFAGWCASGYLPVVSSHAVDGYYDKVYTVEKSEDTVYEAEDDSGNLYTTLDQAIESAKSGSVITLLTVARLQNRHDISKTLTIDLADYGVIMTNSLNLNSGADLTLKRGDWSVQTSNTVFQINSGAKLKVESGSFSKTNTWSNYLFYLQGGELEITGGTFDWSYNQIIYANGSNYNTLNISGGDFTNTYSSNNSSNRCIIYWDSSSGTQTKSEISGGTFRRGWLNIYNSCLSITGGEFLSEISLNGYSNTPYIKGGLWAFQPSSSYIRTEYKASVSTQTIAGYSGTVYEVVLDPSAAPTAEDDQGNKFYSVADIISDSVSGSTVTLLKDATWNQYWNLANKKLTLDLDGHTVTVTNYMQLQSGADLTVTGDGTWSVQTSSNVFRINSGAKLTVESGSFSKTSTWSNYLFYLQGGELEITGGSFDWSYYHIIYAYSSNSNKLTVTGGDFSATGSNNYIVYWDSSSGTNNQSVISGGTFRCGIIAVYNSCLRITDGIFKNGVAFNGNSGTGYLEGGHYAVEPLYLKPFCVSGLVPEEDEEYTIEGWTGKVYKLVSGSSSAYVAKDETGKTYKTLEDALSSLHNNEVITLLDDAVMSNSRSISQPFTIDLAGHGILVTNGNWNLQSGAKLTITGGGTWSIQTSNTVFQINSGAKLKVESGSFSKTSTWSNYLFYLQGGELEITGGSFDWSYYHIIYAYSSNSNKLTVTGGDFSATGSDNYIVIWDSSSGTQTKSEISGGTFRRGWLNIYNSSLTITGGEFLSEISLNGYSNTPYIKGGLWAFQPSSSLIVQPYIARTSSQTISGHEGTVYEIVRDPSATPMAEDDQGNKFYSFAEIAADAVDGSTVTLLKNATLSQQWSIANKQLTLDLDGHTVTVTNYMQLQSGADLTVTGDGTWSVQTSSTVFYINSGAKLTVESGSFSKTSTWSNYLFYLQGGELEITGGTFDWSYNQIIYANGSNYNTLNISGGDFTNSYSSNNSGYRAILYWDSSSGTQTKSEISGGTFKRGWLNIWNSSLTITGGEFLSEISLNGDSGRPFIKGGLWAYEPSSYYVFGGYKAQASSQTISGYSGTVYEIVEDPDAEPLAVDDQGNNFYSVSEIMSGSVSGSTVTFKKDVTWNQYWSLSNKQLTLDLDGHTVTMTNYMQLQSGADLTLKGGTWSVQTSSNVFRINSGAKLTVESGSFSKTNTWSNRLFDIYGGELVITGGTFNWSYYHIIYTDGYSSNKLTISGGDFTANGSENYIVYWRSGSDNKSVISGGMFRSGMIYVDSNYLTITGGTFMSAVSLNGDSSYRYVYGGKFAFNPKTRINTRIYYVVTGQDTIEGYSGTVYSVVPKSSSGGGSNATPTYVGAPGRLLAAPIVIMAPLTAPTEPNNDGDPTDPTDPADPTEPTEPGEGGESAEVEGNIITFTLQAGETITFHDLPASANYRIWEETKDGWTLVAVSGETGTIKPLETSTAIFTNKFDAGSTSATLTGTKYLDGALSGESFSFTVHQISGPDMVADRTVTSAAGGVISLGTYTYTQTGDYVYEITENDPTDKYVKDTHTEYVTVRVSLNETYLTATVIYDEDGAVFNNYTKPGVINVKKSIDSAVTIDPGDKLFTFKVTLTDKYGRAFTDDMRAKTAEGYLSVYVEMPDRTRVELENGTATFRLKANETAVVRNVPENVNYEIEETNLPGGWSLKRWIGQNTGTMTAFGSVNVTAMNTYTSGSVAKGYSSITAHKRYVGAELTSGAFTFELYELESAEDRELTEAKRIETVTNGAVDTAETVAGDDGETLDNPWVGTAPARFSDIVYTEAKTYYYAVREVAGTDTMIEYDEHIEYVTVTVTDTEDGRLVASVEYDADGALFENRLRTGSLRVEKTLKFATEAASEKEFTFTVTLTSKDGTELTGTYNVTIGSLDAENTETRSTTVTSGGTVAIKGSEYFEIEGLPHEAKYEITETQLEGFDKTEVNGEEGLTAEGTITAGATSTEKYLNYYSTTGSLNDRVNPVIKKIFHGGNIVPNQFKFALYEVTTDEEGTETETYVETSYANEDGTIFFAAFDFTNEDDGKTYVYRVYEIEDEREGEVIFDLEPITLTISISDNGEGKLTAEVEKDRDAFENYKVYALTVAKRVGAGADAEAEYSFTVKFTKDGTPFDPERLPANWEKTGDGEYSFKLKDGESGRVSIPAGVTYTLTEETGDGYRASYEIGSNNGAETVYGGGNVVTRTINGEFGSETVTVINTLAELEIAKESDAEASDKAADEFSFEISFTYHGSPYDLETMPAGWERTGDGTYSFKLKSGESVKVKTSADVSYRVTETDRADYAESWTAEGVTGEGRTAEGTVNNGRVEFTNVKLVGLKIRKLVNGSETDKAKAFAFSIRFEKSGSVYAPEVPETWTKNEDGSYSFSLKDGEETGVWIADGVSYTVSETDAEAYITRYSVKSASGAETASGEAKSVSGAAARSASAEDTVTFTNTGFTTITVSKNVVGPNANRTMKFTFELRLSLNGAAYDLERLPEGWTKKSSGVYEFTLAHGESVTVSVPVGTRYELSEAADERYSVKISVNGDETEGRSVEGTVSDPENGVEIAVTNRNEQIIPTGAELWSGLPMLLVPGLALAVILLRKRREREE